MSKTILSQLSDTLVGSEIVKLGGEIRDRIRKGEKIYNFTVGDFDPAIFPIPKELEDGIVTAYRQHFTNYPAAEGNLDLREALQVFLEERQQLSYSPAEILVAGGGRPLIYSLFRAVCDKDDKVIYAVPSWNNNHYANFVGAKHVVIEAVQENNFMPTVEQIRPHIKDATLLALCSPQNPTGTTFTKEDLLAICQLVVEENNRRGEGVKKLYVMYDQMYSLLTYGKIVHYNPVSLHAGMRPYTIYIDAISKVFAATGVRVGWSVGPAAIIDKMKAIMTHLGSWAPMAEQKAVAGYLSNSDAIDKYLSHFKNELSLRLNGLYEGLQQLKQEGYAVDAIAPQGAIYLTVQFNCTGKKTAEGKILQKQADVTAYLLDVAKLAVVPFYAFGAAADSSWYRLSVGTCKKEEIKVVIEALRNALQLLQ
ncbi:MAG TPA: aminotransferase class I/II-fold pyridoxal phosphate-dependent enzyme [Chitinophagaceae bacterium]|nr:aminotransferase class I/II-fold pyridoxal phosphate-dependent enzyme [Chitinophagaceae bacterium]